MQYRSYFIFILPVVLLLQSCVISHTNGGLTGKVLPRGSVQIGWGTGIHQGIRDSNIQVVNKQFKNYFDIVDSINSVRKDGVNDALNPYQISSFPLLFPPEIYVRAGVYTRLDLAFTMSPVYYKGLVRYQLLGHALLPFALSVGLGMDYGSFGSSFKGSFLLDWEVTFLYRQINVIPAVYISLHPASKLAFYVTPKYIYSAHRSEVTLSGNKTRKNGTLHSLGTVVGMQIGSVLRHAFLEGSYQYSLDNAVAVSSLQVLVGFNFGIYNLF